MNDEEITYCPKNTEGKLKILVDENSLDPNLIKYLKKIFNVKMAVKNKGLDDYNVLYGQARNESRVILTNDQDFWNNKYPFEQAIGILIIPNKDADVTIKILKKFFVKLGKMYDMGRYCNDRWGGLKVKVQQNGFILKYKNEDGSIHTEDHDYTANE
ncbi:MAG: DUF5615 family PIN-like protein [Candidatus Methanoperedens sp.]|nr:DUF5615 family PIN-like protein [Candidatus Methanoperedens sp.]